MTVSVQDHELDFVGSQGQGPVKTTEMHFVHMQHSHNLVEERVEVTDHEMEHVGGYEQQQQQMSTVTRPVYSVEYKVVPHYYTTYHRVPVINS